MRTYQRPSVYLAAGEIFIPMFYHRAIRFIFSAYKDTIKRAEYQRKLNFSLYSRAEVSYLKLRISEENTK